jgi:hypothetical protein
MVQEDAGIRGAGQRVDSQAAKIVDQQYATDLT